MLSVYLKDLYSMIQYELSLSARFDFIIQLGALLHVQWRPGGELHLQCQVNEFHLCFYQAIVMSLADTGLNGEVGSAQEGGYIDTIPRQGG